MYVLKKIYKGFPLHFADYENDTNLILHFINFDKLEIKELTLNFLGTQKTFPINSNEAKITLTIDEEVNNIPKLVSVVANNKTYYLKDYPEFDTVTTPKAIHALGPERELYKRDFKKKFNYTDVKCIYEEAPKYWHCVCGHTNFSIVDKCENCGKEKEKLAQIKPAYTVQAASRHQENKVLSLFLTFFISIYLIDIFVQIFSGDFLFPNYDKNTFFAVSTRFLAPALIIVVIGLMMFFNHKYKKIISLALKIVFFMLVLFLNITPVISFIGTAYNLKFLWALDILLIILIIKSIITESKSVYNYSLLGITTVFFFVSIFLFGAYRNYDIAIYPEGVSLVVQDEGDKVKYEIPEEINNMDVSIVLFDRDRVYEMEELVISKNVKTIGFGSTANFKNLKTIEIKDGNPVYSVFSNILYKEGDINLVPLSVTEVEINNRVVNARAFFNHYNLESITIGADVEVIEKQAFENAINLESIIFAPNGSLTTIEAYAFRNTGIVEIDIPITVNYLGIGILEGCNQLVNYRVPFIGRIRENHDDFFNSSDIFTYHFGSVHYNRPTTIPESLKHVEVYDIDRIHHTTFYNAWYVESIVLPDELLNMGLKSFFGCRSLVEFTIPNNVTEIREECFRNCYSLETIIIPATVTNIEKNAFLNCDSLSSVVYLGDKTNLTIDPIGNESLTNLLN